MSLSHSHTEAYFSICLYCSAYASSQLWLDTACCQLNLVASHSSAIKNPLQPPKHCQFKGHICITVTFTCHFRQGLFLPFVLLIYKLLKFDIRKTGRATFVGMSGHDLGVEFSNTSKTCYENWMPDKPGYAKPGDFVGQFQM